MYVTKIIKYTFACHFAEHMGINGVDAFIYFFYKY